MDLTLQNAEIQKIQGCEKMMRNCVRILMMMLGVMAVAGLIWFLMSGAGSRKSDPDGTLVQLMHACGVMI
jgi:hypothetical protein